ncbi:MAG: K+ channel, inward rectifier [Bacteroidetes bacterium]|nr:K+ channel, inward rectifier [Bacteroidota bacterium]
MNKNNFFRRKQSNPNEDLGFGTKVTADRIMNKDGSFFMERVGDAKFQYFEIYHNLITMSWPKFLTLLVSAYFCSNLLFAIIYFIIGVEHLTGIDMQMGNFNKFMEAFFFSSQTLTTVGFGRIAPMGTITSIVAAVESMLGVLAFAIATGLLYGRFSRPMAKLLYSKNAIIAPFKNGTGLMFRLTNLRHNQLIEVEMNVTIAYFEKESTNRAFERLKLERDKVSLFPTSWTIVHPIDEESPLYGADQNDLKDMKIEIIILLKAFDDTFSQTIYSRTSFHSNEILWGKKFLPMFSVKPSGQTVLDIRKIDLLEDKEIFSNKIVSIDQENSN